MPCNKILDVGVGTGIIASKLAGAGKTVYGVDSNAKMLEIAKQKITEGTKNNFFLVQKPADSLDFEKNSFDGVLCINVLYNVSNPHRVLSGIHNVLRDKGILVLSGPRPCYDLDVLCRAAIKDWKEKGLFLKMKKDIDVIIECNRDLINKGGIRHVYDSNELSKILEQAGFTSVLYSDDTTYCSQLHFIAARK